MDRQLPHLLNPARPLKILVVDGTNFIDEEARLHYRIEPFRLDAQQTEPSGADINVVTYGQYPGMDARWFEAGTRKGVKDFGILLERLKPDTVLFYLPARNGGVNHPAVLQSIGDCANAAKRPRVIVSCPNVNSPQASMQQETLAEAGFSHIELVTDQPPQKLHELLLSRSPAAEMAASAYRS